MYGASMETLLEKQAIGNFQNATTLKKGYGA
jgi:hypothetical protein